MNKELQDYFLKVSGVFYDVHVTAGLDCPKKALDNCPEEFKPLAKKIVDGEIDCCSFATYIATREFEAKQIHVANPLLQQAIETLRQDLVNNSTDFLLEAFDILVTQSKLGEHSV